MHSITQPEGGEQGAQLAVPAHGRKQPMCMSVHLLSHRLVLSRRKVGMQAPHGGHSSHNL